MSDNSSKTLVALTTYAGDLESRIILRKVLKHLKSINDDRIFILVVSDGFVSDPTVHTLADKILDRPGPSGLHQGELDSIWEIVRFIKSAGDIIMTQPNWAQAVMARFEQHGAQILSTHWFYNQSWIVGTKFFVANTNFLEQTLPQSIDAPNLEEAFTAGIIKQHDLKKVADLINTATGERHEVEYELKEWGWEHAHRLTKFVCIDQFATSKERTFNQGVLYPALRIKRDIIRSARRILKKIAE